MGCCSALNCSNSSEKNFRMFRFPSNPERRKKWIENCRREGWVPGPNAQLCSAHFDENQYEKHRQDGFKKLTPCAVPTIFPEKNSNTVKTVMTIKIEPPEEDDIVFPNLDFTTDNLLTPKTEPPDEEGAVKSCKVEAASPEVNQETPSPLTTSSKHELITKGNHLEEKLCSKESIQNGISFSSSPWILIPKLSLFPVLGESKLMTSDSLNKSSQLPISQQESCSKTNDSNFSNNSLSSRPILKPVVPVRKSSRIAQKKTKFKDLFKRSNLPITLLPEYGKKEVDAKRPQQMPPDIIESKRPRFTTWRKLVPIMPKITVTEELPQKEGYILAKTGTTNSDPKVEKKVVKAVNLFGSESIPKETKKDSTKEDAKSPPVSMDLGKGDETGNKMAASETGSISEAETMEPSIVGDCLAYKPGHTAVLGIPGIVESAPVAVKPKLAVDSSPSPPVKVVKKKSKMLGGHVLRKKNDTLLTENASLKKRLAIAEKYGDEVTRKNVKLQAEIRDFTKNNSEMNKVIQELEKHNNALFKRLGELQDSDSELPSKPTLHKRLDDLVKENSALNKKVDTLERQNKDLKIKLKLTCTEEQLKRLDKIKSLGIVERYTPKGK